MSSKKVNSVLQYLIDEIKGENEYRHESISTKGLDIAKSLLQEETSINKEESPLTKRKEFKEKKSTLKENENHCEKQNNVEENDESDNLDEKEKSALEFYDEKIDDYNEAYVNKKYRFLSKNCDSSLCCCGCFTPVCYQSQRHDHYSNQFRGLYALNVTIDRKTIIEEKDINKTKVEPFEQMNEKETPFNNINNNNNIESRDDIKYHPVFCDNCNNHIAYYEINEEVFHFFDVLPD